MNQSNENVQDLNMIKQNENFSNNSDQGVMRRDQRKLSVQVNNLHSNLQFQPQISQFGKKQKNNDNDEPKSKVNRVRGNYDVVIEPLPGGQINQKQSVNVKMNEDNSMKK